MQENWLISIEHQVDEQVEKYISVKDYRFYQIDRFKKVAYRIDMYEKENCVECRHMKKDVEDIARRLSSMINGPGALRKEYEDKLDSFIKHLRIKHDVYPPFYFAYHLSFKFMLWGIALGLLISYSLFLSFQWQVLLICWGLGIIVGNFKGSRRDSAVRRAGKLL